MQVALFGLVELKGAGDRIEHRFGDPGQIAPLEPDVVVRGQTGQHGHFFPP